MKDTDRAAEALNGVSLTLTNARIVLKDDVINGTLRVEDGIITAIDTGNSALNGAIDLGGDFLSPGLVELHTDNLERHMQPRPGVKWPTKAAAIAHDAELASVGITTVFDALRVGSSVSQTTTNYRKYARELANDILDLQNSGAMRISHFLHLRAEICSETLIAEMEEFSRADRVGIVSLMDHTPGQRQFRDLSKMDEYLRGKYGMTPTEISAHYEMLYAIHEKYGAVHEEGAARIGRDLGAVLASHDDTTVSDVDMSIGKGVRVAEFPTTLEAAKACQDADIRVMMGAPNLLRGGSHSGNVAAQELVQDGVLDVLSSDYAPSSLLMGAVRLGLEQGNMATGLRTVTHQPAHAVDLQDRGEIAVGKRADLLAFSLSYHLPCIKGVWSNGQRVG
ncbi:alpha-D-ribose 1-methylphosphonate 5-triphosphate diphosphatase [Neptunicoccus cionae]|uniref:Phosphonate metabolism protein PhnM n=1 Tax=Neptunicoccus cionae TaxID=2035344 RepID=A0A916QY27_9RHOB|nr:alpha-D-ribose 1-methylphosphonate 5-triphosphate diphosphatase [Amylibacter cionae]GGA17273.1 phosphonate metabolism protein PhnM [Amylibacter cionae]